MTKEVLVQTQWNENGEALKGLIVLYDKHDNVTETTEVSMKSGEIIAADGVRIQDIPDNAHVKETIVDEAIKDGLKDISYGFVFLIVMISWIMLDAM